MDFTPEQKLILDNCDKDIYISACPGSGKSTVLGAICGKLLDNPKNKILLVTFTNAAARSIVDKCEGLDKSRLIAGTFHGIAFRMLKANGMTANICDEHKKRLIIKTLFKCKKDKDKFEEIYDHICASKSLYPVPKSAEVTQYNEELKKYNIIDFDDIISTFIEHLPLSQLQGITKVLVDELQDTSMPQFEMLKQIRTVSGANFVGVADDDQCIYEWRGARPANVTDFIKYTSCTVFNMGTNFRSNATIVGSAAKLIENNKKRIKKEFRSYTDKTGLVMAYKCQDPFEEIDYVVMKCQQNNDKPVSILYRNRTFKYHLEFKLKKAGLKYKVNDFLDITDRSAVRVMVACLKIASNSYDYFDLELAAKALKGIGAATLKKIKEESEKTSFNDVISRWLEDPKLKRSLRSIPNLQSNYVASLGQPLDILVLWVEHDFVSSFDYQSQMKELLIDITKMYKVGRQDIADLANELGLNDQEENNDEGAMIELSTIHGYKGLEANTVIIPFSQMFLAPVPGRIFDEESERRLFYVGITRAKEKLYITYSGDRPSFLWEMGV